MLDKIVGFITSMLGGDNSAANNQNNQAAGGQTAPAAATRPAQSNHPAMSPINGISLEKYAELCAKMANCSINDDEFARIAAENGVARADWEAARKGWNERMENTATAPVVAIAYMPLYQAALAKYGGPVATATFEEYIEMTAMINTYLETEPKRPKDFEPMYAKFGINPQKWSQISTYWVDRLTKEMDLAQDFQKKTEARIKELDAEFLRSVGR
jgi:hypothetical protein